MNLMSKLLSATVVAVAFFALAGSAAAASDPVVRDCANDGSVDGHYTQGQYKHALGSIPSDVDEYTDCRSVIRGAQLGSAGHKNRRGGNGVSSRIDTTAPPSAGEQAQIGKAAGGHGPVDVGGAVVRPGAAAQPFNASGLGGELPPLFVALLIAAACAALAGGAFALRRSPRASAPFARIGDGVRRGISRFRR